MKKDARYNVISVRLNDDELESLNEIVRTRRMSVASLVREAMSQLASHVRKPTSRSGASR